jgi:tRNA (adenine22-N1)-methyltransferase
LSAAKQNAEFFGLSDRIEFILCDGLDSNALINSDVVIIAGMGGENTAGILERAPVTREGGRLLILQPMSKSEYLRKWLNDNDYTIKTERLVLDCGKIYQIIVAIGGADGYRPYTAELYTGWWEKITATPYLIST